ncbi:MAG TPA: EAL domain-containing protein [Cellulomonas sp.]|uniref:EAL domain-containing protein n=1 Tax=Cellulomonas sp. TaxID=40001 RepID=UPI002E34C03B|nr:EAL domain-containing protein [Cellulomonas sp.]HEX5332557.1 EAL domain-containing protein [Cellulomonas sp.]
MAESDNLLVLAPWTAGFYFGEIISGITREAAAAGRRVIVAQTLHTGQQTDLHVAAPDFSTRCAWDHVAGAVAVAAATQGPYLHALRRAGKAVSLASNDIPGFDAPVVMPDNDGGTRAAVQHLLEHGHRRIGFVGNLTQSDMRERYAAYQDTLVEAGLAPRPEDFYPASDNVADGGKESARPFLEQSDRPTAVVVATDLNALGFMRAVTTAGLDVPRDVAVVGFDDIEAGAFGNPSLASVNQRFDVIGALAARLLMAQIHGEEPSADTHAPPSHVVRRTSCGCRSLDDRTPRGPGSVRDETSETLRRRLESALATATTEGSVGEAVATAVAAISTATERLLGAGHVHAADRLLDTITPLAALATRPGALLLVDSAVDGYLRTVAERLPDEARTTRAALAQVGTRASGALWHLQTTSSLDRVAGLEAALIEEYEIGRALLRHGTADPRRLDWLAGSHVRTAVLALWRGDGLVIEGVHDADGLLGDLVGTVTTPETFPPLAVVESTNPSVREVVFVVAVRANDRDWGMLAVVDTINTTSIREPLSHWAALLCAAFEQEDLAATLRTSEERYGLLARAMNEGLWDWDGTTGRFTLSERCVTLLGIDPAAVDPGEAWTANVHPDDAARVRAQFARVVHGELAMVEVEHRYRPPLATEYRWMLARAMPVHRDGTSSPKLLGSITDIDDRKQLEETLRHNALYDAATGLPNRRMFLSELTRSVERWVLQRTPFAVVFLDLDRFKVVNDSLGHQVGDLLLQEVAERLRDALRSHDTPARFGGDEFAVLLDDIGPDDVPMVVRRIQDALARPVEIDGHALWVTASMGVASSAVDYASAEDVLRDADTAMYHAKSLEPGTLSFFDAAMHDDAVSHVHLQAAVQAALDLDQFVVHYQPIVDLVGGRVDRFEALVRWQHPERGLIGPDEFLPIMQETALIVRLGRWIIGEVCRQIAAWRSVHDGVVTVSVNVSDREFWHPGLVDHVRACLREHDLSPETLTLEITEGVIMRRPELARHIMDDMHRTGLRLHIDDFGAGHSSLQTLHRYPVEALKIDRAFITGLTEGTTSLELVRAIIAMADALGLEVIAEGIETTDQLAMLRAIGCSIGQGFLFDRAVTGDRAAVLLGGSFATGEDVASDDLVLDSLWTASSVG